MKRDESISRHKYANHPRDPTKYAERKKVGAFEEPSGEYHVGQS